MKTTAVFLSVFFSVQLYAQPKLIQTDAEVDLIPEGIAVDHRTGTIYISSINHHKILAVTQAGETRDFINPGYDGFMEGLGLKVDQQRNWLWALSVLREGKKFLSKIHAFDLATGRTMQQYGVEDTLPHLFNDLVITDSCIYVTDTYFSAVYKVDPVAKTMALFLQSRLLSYPNGITAGNQSLYIATYRNGIVRVTTATKEIIRLPGFSDSAIVLGLDGLLFHDNSLMGIYNTGEPSDRNCVISYRLDPSGNRIISEKIIDRGNHYFSDPTTVALYESGFYVIANSHLDVFNANKTSTRGIEKQLRALSILVYGEK
jgi:hypothetical protein